MLQGIPNMPFHGAVTDLQVWDRVLEDEGVVRWLDCTPGTDREGNLLTWDTLNLNISGLVTQEIEASEICPKKDKQKEYLHLNFRKGFEDTRKLCKNVGAEIATIDSQETYDNIIKDLDESCTFIFAGYKYREDSGWVDVNTGMALEFRNWDENEPLNQTGKRFN